MEGEQFDYDNEDGADSHQSIIDVFDDDEGSAVIPDEGKDTINKTE